MKLTEPSSLQPLLGALGASVPDGAGAGELESQLAGILQSAIDDGGRWSDLWLIWSTLRGELPTEEEVVTFQRDATLNGASAAIRGLGARADASIFGLSSEVEIVTDAVVIDVHNTSSTRVMSGIQRVVRETVGLWAADHEVVLVAWTESRKGLRRLTPREEARMRGGDEDAVESLAPARERVVIPNGGLVIVPELSADSERAERFLALGEFAGSKLAFIGYDCVPLTSGETAAGPMAAHFPLYLDAVAYSDKVAAISRSTADEFIAWKKMLPSSGRVGPDVRTVFLGGDSAAPSDVDLAAVAAELELGDLPVVLVVGSHEPRKNHLSVLQAARVLWSEGAEFRLLMIGAGSWNSAPFDQLSQHLQDEGWPLTVLSGASDATLGASYRLATVSIFTSFHEGFGLPIVESLRAGTPVIASDLGSMAEIAAHYGGVIGVDPHSDEALESALRSVLSDPAVLAQKKRDLAGNDYRSWESYADETWQYFTA
ncbi:glycosyltransferase family 1 protein [Subtercola sp. Z020]|uniref:glycosyltransferase family 4 protein n=1 Tax=Subtercola sp. Z020 TaxID=2080582 RepID=UPI00130DD90F|nr:glycosyltransferase family 1 protein [Subtercola sp. Z020]